MTQTPHEALMEAAAAEALAVGLYVSERGSTAWLDLDEHIRRFFRDQARRLITEAMAAAPPIQEGE